VHRLAQTDASLPLTSPAYHPCNSIRFVAGHKNGHSRSCATDPELPLRAAGRKTRRGAWSRGGPKSPRVVLSTGSFLCWKPQTKGAPDVLRSCILGHGVPLRYPHRSKNRNSVTRGLLPLRTASLPDRTLPKSPIMNCSPVDVDLSLVRMPDDTRRVFASSPNGTIVGGLDVPVAPAPTFRELRWGLQAVRGYDFTRLAPSWGGSVSYSRGILTASAGVVGSSAFVGVGLRF
jgi:hypothetical protein